MKKWSDIYSDDFGDTRRGAWVSEVREARSFLDNDFNPLADIGLNEAENPWFKISSIPEIRDYIYGRLFANALKPTVKPHEGQELEEDVRKICDAVFNFEMRSKRGPFNLNLLREIKLAVMDALGDGYGAIDTRIDSTLRTPVFYRGLPVYNRIDPLDLVFDHRAKRLDEIRHLHIITKYDPDEFEDIFGIKLSDLSPGALEDEDDKELIRVVETQYRKIEVEETFEVSDEMRDEFNLEARTISKSDLRKLIKDKHDSDPEQYGYLNYRELTEGLRSFRQQHWGVYSEYWAGDSQKPLIKEEYIGKVFTPEILGFFPKSGCPYYSGVPFFLKDAQNMEIIGRTLQARMLMRADNPGAIVKRKLDPALKEQIEKNRIGDIYELDSPDDLPVDAIIKFRDVSVALPYLSDYLNFVQYSMHNRFGATKEQRGQAPFSGASGTLVDNLMQAGSYMFVVFVEKMNEWLPCVFDRVLRLSLEALPTEALMYIAGENDEGRAELIQSGKIYDRILQLNASVTLDTTSAQDQAAQRQIMANMVMKGSTAPSPSAYAILGYDEPEKMSRETMEWMAMQSRGMSISKRMEEDPIYAQAINAVDREYQKLTGNTANGKPGASSFGKSSPR